MPVFYIFSGLIGCIASQVTLGLQNKDFSSFLSITYIFILGVIIAYISITSVSICIIFTLYYFFPATYELIIYKFINQYGDYFILKMADNQTNQGGGGGGGEPQPSLAIDPKDPNGQLSGPTVIYNRYGSN